MSSRLTEGKDFSLKILFIYLFVCLFIYLRERECVCACAHARTCKRKRERESETDSAEYGAQSHDPKIMTWVEAELNDQLTEPPSAPRCKDISHTLFLNYVIFQDTNFIFIYLKKFFFFYYLFMIVIQREREAETQAEGEAGSMHWEPDVGFDPGSSGSHPGPKAGTQLLRHPGIPLSFISCGV